MNVLDIKSPQDIKSLSIDELNTLCVDIREFLIESISKTGGHLGSSLGTVELIVAMHYEFNSPKDKMVFDIGHQAYAHKILTGRAKGFKDLRKYKGMSGFLKKEESDHDVWEAGHSSNSISAAVGYAMQRDLDKEDNEVICLIGDGSMTNGMSLEALNHLIEVNKKVIIIINDNEMSISNNIGFINNMFKSLDLNESYYDTKNVIRESINKIDKSQTLTKLIRGFKNKLKNEINGPRSFFNSLGFKYYGPVNGHDIKSLLHAFKTVKNYDGPIVMHVKTTKGKGYLPAEKNLWHGVSKFDIKTGNIKPKDGYSNSKVVSEYLQHLMSKDNDIVVITPAMISGSELVNIEKNFPNRITDVGIAEEHGTSLMAGLALAKKKPFLSIYSTFLQRSYDQIFQDVVRQKCNVVVGIDRAGLVGEDGETHQGIYDISFLNHMPGVTIMQAKDAYELKGLLKLAFEVDGPMFIRYSKNAYNTKLDLSTDAKDIEYGKWEVLSLGTDVNIISYGEDLIDILKEYKDNKKVGVINARFIKPIDEKLLNSIKDTKIIVLEESAKIGSLGQMILSYYNDKKESVFLDIMAIEDNFVEQGSVNELKKEQKIDLNSLKKRVDIIINE